MDYYVGSHESFEKVIRVDISGRQVEQLVTALETICDLATDVHQAYFDDIHIYNIDVNGAHISLEYSENEDDHKNQNVNGVDLRKKDELGSDKIKLRIWEFQNVATPADVSAALKKVLEDISQYQDEYYLDMTSSGAITDDYNFSLRLHLYTTAADQGI